MFASKGTIVHRRDSFRASKILVECVLQHDKIDVLWNTVIEGYEGKQFLSALRFLLLGNEMLEIRWMKRYKHIFQNKDLVEPLKGQDEEFRRLLV